MSIKELQSKIKRLMGIDEFTDEKWQRIVRRENGNIYNPSNEQIDMLVDYLKNVTVDET